MERAGVDAARMLLRLIRLLCEVGPRPQGFHGEVLCGMGLVAMGKAPLYRDFIS